MEERVAPKLVLHAAFGLSLLCCFEAWLFFFCCSYWAAFPWAQSQLSQELCEMISLPFSRLVCEPCLQCREASGSWASNHVRMQRQGFPVRVETQGRRGRRACVLRVAQPDDAAALRELIVQVVLDAPRTQAMEADEVRDVEKQRKRIAEFADKPDGLALVAIDEATGTMIGELTGTPGARRRLAHNWQLGMLVAQSARGQGVGKALLTHALNWARTRPTLRVARLACVASNVPARSLYESCGFQVDGMQRGFFVFEDGTMEDDVIMSLRL